MNIKLQIWRDEEDVLFAPKLERVKDELYRNNRFKSMLYTMNEADINSIPIISIISI